MLVKRVRQVQKAAALFQEVMEMEGAFLRARVLGHTDGEHRAPHDASLNLRTGIDTNRGDRVIERIEIVVLG